MGVMAHTHTCILSTSEVGAGGSVVQGQPPVHSQWVTKKPAVLKKKKKAVSNYCCKNNYLLQCQILS